MKCLEKYSFNQFEKYVTEELQIADWYVWDEDLGRRATYVNNRDYFKKLKQKSENKLINATDKEIVTWLDTLKLLRDTLQELPKSILNELIIIQEYVMPFDEKRADYLLIHNNRILIIEFSYEKYNDYGNKVQQALGYKELLQDLLPNYIDVGTYVYKYKSELNDYLKTKINKFTNRVEPINNEIKFSCKNYIRRFFEKDPIEQLQKDIAINELYQISVYEDNRIQEINKNDKTSAPLEQMLDDYYRAKKSYADYIVTFEHKHCFYVFDADADNVSKQLYQEYKVQRIVINGEEHSYLEINKKGKEYLMKSNLIASGTCFGDLVLCELSD